MVKNYLKIASLLTLLTGCKYSDQEIINKTIDKLNSIKTVEYQIRSHYLQRKMGMEKIDTAICFFDFTSNDTLIGAKYQFKGKGFEQVFDGAREFTLDIDHERILFTEEPDNNRVKRSIFMINSMYVLKKQLQNFVDDSLISFTRQNDTIIYDVENYFFKIEITDKRLGFGADLKEMKGQTNNYQLFISKSDFLPTQFNQIYPDSIGHWNAHFSKMVLQAYRPDSTWDLNRFPSKYLKSSYKEFYERMKLRESINLGQKAPEWILPIYSEDFISLSDLKGNLILLEFWYPYCSGCVKAIPHINKLHKEYSEKGLKTYGIEFTQENSKGLDKYIKKQKIEYPILYSGKDIAKQYGVYAAPTFFLINSDGIIVYTSIGLNKDELIKSIEDNI